MPLYIYKGRDKSGALRKGERFAENPDDLNSQLTKEGIYTTEISVAKSSVSFSDKFKSLFYDRTMQLEELAIFAKQMQLLTNSGVPIVSSLRQLADYTRSKRLSVALKGISDHLEKGQNLSNAMKNYPDVFTPLIISIVGIGENTGHLTEAFSHLHSYLNFEAKNRKMLKATFRYPIFVVTSIFLAIIILNIFVIPTFARFYTNIEVALPWETRFLIGMSNLFVHYGLFMLIGSIVGIFLLVRYLKTPSGSLKFSHFLLRMPVFGKIYKRILLIRFAQSLAIILNSGVLVSQGLGLVKGLLNNRYIEEQIAESQESIERGTSFTQAMNKIELFSPLEYQIISVGEKNGELGTAMEYISTFQGSEIEFEIKRLNDMLGPALITLISGLILIVALGIYLPVWNMINLVK